MDLLGTRRRRRDLVVRKRVPLRWPPRSRPRQARCGSLSDPAIRLRLSGPVGERVGANVGGWLLPCPAANPGLARDVRAARSQAAPQLVPWAGEFVGKYLISAIQALRMVDDPALEKQVAEVVRQVCDAQAEDGYLGPFPREQRLLATGTCGVTTTCSRRCSCGTSEPATSGRWRPAAARPT